ncbi:MAG: FkbM family methyltransferase [Planctomycetota bacterium]|jgi:FkbM family methyltransferase
MIEDLIYDVGMHNGDDTAYYLEKEFQVVAVEANPVLVQRARKRFAHAIAERRLQILNEAIGPEAGTGTFWINDDNDEHSSFDREVCERNGSQSRSIEVEYVPFAEILAACGVPYYLKIDIERADIHCLRALDRQELPKYVSVEAHELEYLTILRDLGYNGFKCIDQTGHNYPPMRHDNESLSGRMRSRLRRSSGPFGEETQGDWHTLETIATDWQHFNLGHRKQGTLNMYGWFDFHARLPG